MSAEATQLAADIGANTAMPPDMANGSATNGAAETVATEPARPFAVFANQEEFEARLQRAERAALQKKFEEYGVTSEEELKTQMAALKDMRAKEEARKKAQMSEIERERELRTAAEQQRAELQERLQNLELDNHVAKLCAERGIRDLGYARYLILSKLESVAEGEELDGASYLDEMLADPAARVALRAETKEQVVSTTPATTTATQGLPGMPGGQPAAPDAGIQVEKRDAFKMTRDEFERYCASL